jgi:hypothetical protein
LIDLEISMTVKLMSPQKRTSIRYFEICLSESLIVPLTQLCLVYNLKILAGGEKSMLGYVRMQSTRTVRAPPEDTKSAPKVIRWVEPSEQS